MPKKTVLISGAGIAGPTLAYWLLKRGFDPVIVERAPRFRTGGYIVDFWGVGFDVAERMGLVPVLRELGYVNDRAKFVDRWGGTRSGFGGDVLRRALGDRFLSIQRGDLARAIYEKLDGKVETIFGDEIGIIAQNEQAVDVRFKSGNMRAFDFVAGADGLHSAVRSMVPSLGTVAERYLGYYAAVFVTEGYAKRDEQTYLSYAEPSRQVSRFALRNDRTGFLLVFAKDHWSPLFGRDLAEQKRLLREIYCQCLWDEWPEIERHLQACPEIYFDAVSQIALPAWSKGRVVLLGDAAYCPSLLAGEGSAFAMAGAYILAGEMEREGDDHARAFGAYESHFRPFIERKQKSARAFASSFTPKTSLGLATRDFVLRLMAIPVLADLLMRRFVTDRYSLPDY